MVCVPAQCHDSKVELERKSALHTLKLLVSQIYQRGSHLSFGRLMFLLNLMKVLVRSCKVMRPYYGMPQRPW